MEALMNLKLYLKGKYKFDMLKYKIGLRSRSQ